MRVVSKGLVFNVAGRPPSEQVAFFDSLFQLKSGSWLCGCTIGSQKHDPNGSIRLSRSRDDGATWSEIPFRFATTFGGVRGSLAGAEFVEVAPGRLLLFTTWFDRTDPLRPLFDPVTEGILHSKLLVAESNDDGETFGPWREIPTPGLTGTALCGPPVHWSDGAIGLAFESFKHFDDPKPAWHAAWLLVSTDGGKTFPRKYLVGEDPMHDVFYWDERLCATNRPGEFIGLFWTHDRAAKKDLNVHFLRASLNDGDRAKTTPTDTGIPGQISSPLILDDGRILGFVVDRDRPGTMKLWRSNDGGKTWPANEALTVHVHDEQAAVTQGKEGVDFAEYWEDMAKWSFGHPAAQLINQREALLTFYAGPPNHLSVHWACVSLE
jgi:hypothetical protein